MVGAVSVMFAFPLRLGRWAVSVTWLTDSIPSIAVNVYHVGDT